MGWGNGKAGRQEAVGGEEEEEEEADMAVDVPLEYVGCQRDGESHKPDIAEDEEAEMLLARDR